MTYKINFIVVLSIVSILFFSFATDVSAMSLTDNVSVAAGETGDLTDSEKEENCNYIFGDPSNESHPAYWIQWVLDVMKYAAILALIIFVIMDFFKAMVADDKDALKKAGVNSLKRFIYCVMIFFLPTLIEFLMNLFGAYGTCGIG